jgi:hypothetical protein
MDDPLNQAYNRWENKFTRLVYLLICTPFRECILEA